MSAAPLYYVNGQLPTLADVIQHAVLVQSDGLPSSLGMLTVVVGQIANALSPADQTRIARQLGHYTPLNIPKL